MNQGNGNGNNPMALAQSKNPVFLAELFAQLQKNPLIQSCNARIEGDSIVVDESIKKNNITYKQLQVGIEFFRVGWNRHRALFTRKGG